MRSHTMRERSNTGRTALVDSLVDANAHDAIIYMLRLIWRNVLGVALHMVSV